MFFVMRSFSPFGWGRAMLWFSFSLIFDYLRNIEMLLPVTAFFAIGTGIELYGLKWTSESLSIINTVSLIMLTFLIGIVVSRSYGNECFERIQRSLKSREAPADEVLNDAVMSLSSMLLITPGIVTDTIALLIMLPATRDLFKGMALKLTMKRIQSGQSYFFFKD